MQRVTLREVQFYRIRRMMIIDEASRQTYLHMAGVVQ